MKKVKYCAIITSILETIDVLKERSGLGQDQKKVENVFAV